MVRRLIKLKAGLSLTKPWVHLMQGVRSSALHRWGATLACPICMEPFAWAHNGKGKALIEFRCTHVTCRDCAAKMAKAGMHKCAPSAIQPNPNPSLSPTVPPGPGPSLSPSPKPNPSPNPKP